jgi:hypothetical protein
MRWIPKSKALVNPNAPNAHQGYWGCQPKADICVDYSIWSLFWPFTGKATQHCNVRLEVLPDGTPASAGAHEARGLTTRRPFARTIAWA